MLFRSAYVALLHRYTAQTEMMIGTPVRGRNRPEVEHLIGNFVNTLVLRVKAAPDQTFSELVRHLRDVTLDAFSNEDMPIEMLGDRPPEIQVLFSFQDARERPRAAGDLTVTQLYRPLPVASNDMMLWTMDYGDHLLAVLNFSTELFEPSTIQRFLRGYASILKYVQQHPDAKLVDLPIAEAEDLDRVASFATPGTPVRADWIGALLESRAKAEPDAVAWSSPEATETFARFDQATNRLARRLAALGAGPGVRVAVALPDPKDYWLALWAALKCRAAVLPLDANAPKRRNASIMTVAAPQLLVTDSRLREELPGQARSVLCLDSEQASVEAESAEPLAPADCDAEMTEAWVRFAVDRDGTPRLVRLSHAALASSVKGLIDGLALDRASLVWLSSPMASEAAMLELLLGPAAGAATVLGDTAHWINELARRSPSAAVAASDQWLHTLDEGWAGRADLSVVLHGAPGEELIARLLPSVASIWRMSAEPELGFAAFLQQLGSPRQANDLGRPVGATRVAVLDASRRAVPIGLVGNVYVSNVGLRLNAGDGVVELDPESRAAGPAVKTSWAGRFNEQGVLQQRGESLDSRVSCDGERFYLEEVERALMAHEAVVDAAAMLYSVAPGDERLVAYFVCKPGANYTETELRGLLRESLPNAMVPRLFVEVPELPKLEDGSVERSRLPSPFSSSAAEYVAPRTETERLLAELWREALKVERVGVYDNFFDLGGHSLLCFKVIAQLEARTGKRINPRLMLLNSLEQVATSFDGSSEQKPSGEPAPASAKDTGVAGRVLKKLGKLGGLLRRT